CRFDEERGRIFAAACNADFGDRRCGISPDDPRWSGQGEIVWSDGAALMRASGPLPPAPRLRGGRLRWIAGANAGFVQEIRDHGAAGAEAALTLWSAPPQPVAAGDRFAATVGCDKQFATCRDQFANSRNFRGFPHMPGNDALLRVARAGEIGMDGGSLFK